MRSLFTILTGVLISVLNAVGGTPEEEAKKLLERYIALEHAFDPAGVDLYSDDAKIENKRTYPDGTVRTTAVPAPKYKGILRTVMPLAKLRGDTSTYSEVKYAVEGQRIRITATRFSNLKKYSSPISFLVGPAADGKWLIFEELSESKP